MGASVTIVGAVASLLLATAGIVSGIGVYKILMGYVRGMKK